VGTTLGVGVFFMNEFCVFIIAVGKRMVALYLGEVSTVIIVEFLFFFVGVETCGGGAIGIIL